ncbi:autophagy-related 17 [Leptinotarsa decemlineata]|uniref:autophagy-related 17 n=1 Tax=Leptinotarsa decemlineata TaxID=7539 RepID=UPI003D3084E4
MSLAMTSVGILKKHIHNSYGIEADKQVLLASGGSTLHNDSSVCSHSAGTDSSPIFLYDENLISNPIPPTISSPFENAEKEMESKVKIHCDMSPSFATVYKRTKLAQEMFDLGKKLYEKCESLVFEQHMQQQGWRAIIANLDDIEQDFCKRGKSFDKAFEAYMSHRESHHSFLILFQDDLKTLKRIPLLPTLLHKRKSNEVEDTSDDCDLTKQITLYEWIERVDDQKSISKMFELCSNSLNEFDDRFVSELSAEIKDALRASQNLSVKEVSGMSERLSGLDSLLRDCMVFVSHQNGHAQAFKKHEATVRSSKDQSVLPDLCKAHENQLILMTENHKCICDILRRCVNAKNELIANLHARLRWVAYVQNRICEMDHKIVVNLTNLKRVQKYLEILHQIHVAPSTYLNAIIEVVRRRKYSASLRQTRLKVVFPVFQQWGEELSNNFLALHTKELERRKQFDMEFKGHFLKTLFPGMNDIPPEFATRPPPPFDEEMPDITEEDIIFLKGALPDMTENIKIPESFRLVDLLGSKGEELRFELTRAPEENLEERLGATESDCDSLGDESKPLEEEPRDIVQEVESDSDSDDMISKLEPIYRKLEEIQAKICEVDLSEPLGVEVAFQEEEVGARVCEEVELVGASNQVDERQSSDEESDDIPELEYIPKRSEEIVARVCKVEFVDLSNQVDEQQSSDEESDDRIPELEPFCRKSKDMVPELVDIGGKSEEVAPELEDIDVESEQMVPRIEAIANFANWKPCSTQGGGFDRECDSDSGSEGFERIGNLSPDLETRQEEPTIATSEVGERSPVPPQKPPRTFQNSRKHTPNAPFLKTLSVTSTTPAHTETSLHLKNSSCLASVLPDSYFNSHHQQMQNHPINPMPKSITPQSPKDIQVKSPNSPFLGHQPANEFVSDEFYIDESLPSSLSIETGQSQGEFFNQLDTANNVVALLQENIEVYKIEIVKLKSHLMKLYKLAQEQTSQLKNEVSELRSTVLLSKEVISQQCKGMDSSWVNVIVEKDIKDKEILEMTQKIAEDATCNLRLHEEEKKKEIKELVQKKKLLEKECWFLKKDLKDMQKSNRILCDQNEETIERLRQNIEQMELDNEKEIKELTEKLNRDHKAEIEAIKQRLKLLTMERSRSDNSLEKSGDCASLPNHLLLQITENFELDKEKSVNEALKTEREKWEKLLEKRVHEMEVKFEEEKQALLDKMSEEREKLPVAVENNERELKEEIDALQEERDILMTQLKSYEEYVNVVDNEGRESRQGTVDSSTSPIKEKEPKSETSSPRPGRVHIDSCKPGDVVVVVWEPTHENFRILQENKHLFFLHSDYLAVLGLEIVNGIPNKYYVVGEVVDKEYCFARKSENRYKVPKRTKFFRVKVKPSAASSSSKDVSQSLYEPKPAGVETCRMTQSQSVVSKISEDASGPSSIPSSPTRTYPIIPERDEPDTTTSAPETVEGAENRGEKSVKNAFAEDSGIVDNPEQVMAALDETLTSEVRNQSENSDRLEQITMFGRLSRRLGPSIPLPLPPRSAIISRIWNVISLGTTDLPISF